LALPNANNQPKNFVTNPPTTGVMIGRKKKANHFPSVVAGE
jgi:hypothetical protein